VFGGGKDYIDVYDLKRAVDDEATVRVYHEPRLIPVLRCRLHTGHPPQASCQGGVFTR
jgi:hypothetical protein